ncbi:hypothetical protein TNCT_600921 [Trichonephila clavata]|uniref:Uncharacterized protein n=1 Tax=Trichonephila clavata TaxID=2740835 RepID=A0A8X6M0T9_TRICU|nr:hypothetical protein TNCT_600921 [Trichonephila clavata]
MASFHKFVIDKRQTPLSHEHSTNRQEIDDINVAPYVLSMGGWIIPLYELLLKRATYYNYAQLVDLGSKFELFGLFFIPDE